MLSCPVFHHLLHNLFMFKNQSKRWEGKGFLIFWKYKNIKILRDFDTNEYFPLLQCLYQMRTDMNTCLLLHLSYYL